MAYKLPIHGRDHCPGGSDPIPCWPGITTFRARRKTTFQTLGGSGIETDLTWNFWENNDATTFTAYTAGGTPTTNPTDTIRTVRLLKAGYYTISGCIAVQALASGFLIIAINDGYDAPEGITHGYQEGSGLGHDFLFAKHASYPVFDPTDSPGGVAEISVDAAQTSGVPRDTQFGTYLEIAYHGATG